jgi:hypothetical protein
MLHAVQCLMTLVYLGTTLRNSGGALEFEAKPFTNIHFYFSNIAKLAI